jgi:hypothetical protein
LKSIVPPIEPLPVPFAFGPLTKVKSVGLPLPTRAVLPTNCGSLTIVSAMVTGPPSLAQRRTRPHAVLHPGAEVVLHATADARIVLIGGAPIDGERHIWWNFVSSSNARIEQAKRDWKEGRFPKVPGDEIESIPLPE